MAAAHSIVAWASLALVGTSSEAHAQQILEAQEVGSFWGGPFGQAVFGKLQPGYASAAHGQGGGLASGFLVAVDAGVAVLFPSGGEPTSAPALTARLGRQLSNGLTLSGRWDDLGAVPSTTAATTVQIVSFAARYAFPFFWPMPFAEVAAGLAFVSNTSPSNVGITIGAGIAVGLAFPITPFLALEVAGRDWFAFPSGAPLLQVPAVQASLVIVIPEGP